MPSQPIPEHPAEDQIRLFDSIQPPLSQGEFDITLEQTFPASVDGVTTHMPKQTQTRRIEVGGSKWAIDSLNVHSRSPPKNEQNVRLDMLLPKIVFQSKTLPWERTVDSVHTTVPWMGLLLLRDDEFEDGYCEVIKDATSHEILGSNTGPLIQLQALRITEKLLKAVGPLQSELELLAHGLQVNPKNKELCGSDEDGLFSVVMSNRLASKADTKYHACLVSYEGFFNKLPTDSDVSYLRSPTAKKGVAPVTKMGSVPSQSLSQQTSVGSGFAGSDIKLVLLDYWTFKTGDGGDFESRIKQIRFRTKEADSEATGELASIYDFAEAQSGNGVYEPALLGNDMDPDVSTNSFLLTEIFEDDGITRTCLYRGPCIAVPANHEPKEKPYDNSDDARGIEPSTGLDVIHHSAAFELGRLLALSDKNFINSLNRWRRMWINKQNQKAYRNRILADKSFSDRFTEEELLEQPISTLLRTGVLNQTATKVKSVDAPVFIERGIIEEIAETTDFFSNNPSTRLDQDIEAPPENLDQNLLEEGGD